MAFFLRITLTSVRAFPPLVSLGRVLDSGEVFLDSETCCGFWELAKLILIDTRGCVGFGFKIYNPKTDFNAEIFVFESPFFPFFGEI